MRKKTVKFTAKTKTVPYDVAAQLRTPEEMAAYLDAWFTEAPDDAVGIAQDSAISHAPKECRASRAKRASAAKVYTRR